MTKAIIPACGLETNNESKEMMIDPVTNSPIIDWSLWLCYLHGITPLVVSHSEKTDLNNYIRRQHKKCELIIHQEIISEWQDVVLSSEDQWAEQNILILPDTRFPIAEFSYLTHIFSKTSLAFATHFVRDPQNWGIIKDFKACEKPQDLKETSTAWGIIAFERRNGRSLFEGFKSKQWFNIPHYFEVYLTEFKNITGTGKVENYER